MDHVGISVANLNRSIEFYRDLLGMQMVHQESFSGDEYERIFGFQGATGNSAMLKAATMKIELFEFVHPSPKSKDPRHPVCDHGITHFCIEVTDIDSVYERLQAAGVHLHCPPLKFFGGARATYGRDPDGNVFELMEIDAAA